MKTQSPLARLIQTRMHQLRLDAQMLGFRLGYQNAAKLQAVSKLSVMVIWQIRKSRAALARLPEALELPSEVVGQAGPLPKSLISEQKRQAEVGAPS